MPNPMESYYDLDREWAEQSAKPIEERLNDGKGLAERKVKGRMENIPENDFDLRNRTSIVKTVIDNARTGNNVTSDPEKSLVYFTPRNLYCSCGYLMYSEVKPLEKKIEAYCINLNCSENLVSKFFDMPSISDYVVSPSQV